MYWTNILQLFVSMDPRQGTSTLGRIHGIWLRTLPQTITYTSMDSMKKWQKRCPNPFSCVDEATCEYLCYKHPVSCSGPDEFMFHMNDDFTMGSVDRNHRSVVEKVYNVWVPELNFHKRNQMKRIHPRGKH